MVKTYKKMKDFTPEEIREIEEATKDEKMICAKEVLPQDMIYSIYCSCPKCSPR